jgi:hypothetical protein
MVIRNLNPQSRASQVKQSQREFNDLVILLGQYRSLGRAIEERRKEMSAKTAARFRKLGVTFPVEA